MERDLAGSEGAATQEVCSVSAPALRSLVDPQATGRQAFGEVENFLNEPSAYRTSWNIVLSRQINATIPRTISHEKLKDQLLAWLRGAGKTTQDEGTSGMYQIYVTSQALKSLGVDASREIQLELNTRETGDGYSVNPGGTTDPTASLYGAAVARAWAIERRQPTTNSWANFIELAETRKKVDPYWIDTVGIVEFGRTYSAGEPTSRQKDRLRRIVEQWWAILKTEQPSGPELANLHWVQQFAHNIGGEHDKTLPDSYFDRLRILGTQYLAAAPGSNGDPQATSLALSLGAKVDVGMLTMNMASGAGSRGWLAPSDFTAPNTTSILIAAIGLHLCGEDVSIPPDLLGEGLASATGPELLRLCAIVDATGQKLEREASQRCRVIEDNRELSGIRHASIIETAQETGRQSSDDYRSFLAEDLTYRFKDTDPDYSHGDIYSTALVAARLDLDHRHRSELLSRFWNGWAWNTVSGASGRQRITNSLSLTSAVVLFYGNPAVVRVFSSIF